MKKKIGVTGAGGYIGRALMMQPNTVAITSDIRDAEKLEMEIKSINPDLVVHLAAITDIDKCENPLNETLVKDVNVVGTFNVGNICMKMGIGMIFMSSFQVFDGKKWFGRAYGEDAVPSPVNFYGLSKLTGESYQAVYPQMKIIRAPYIFDWERLNPAIEVLGHSDQEYPTFFTRSFMHLNHFIDSLLYYISQFDRMPPILNISTSDTVSWFQFMSGVVSALMLDHDALPRTKENMDFKTPKPYKGGLKPNLSYSLGFECYSYLDGIELLRQGL